jgi:hypothetical protein
VFLGEPLDRFARVEAGRSFEGGPLIFIGQIFQIGPEDEVRRAYEDRCMIDGVKGVTPALEATFKLETWYRADTERRRAEAECRRREEERRQAIVKQLGDAVGRREMAKVDFAEAARAALVIGGAEFLDARRGQVGEYVVRFRLLARRFECVVGDDLVIHSAGICLTAHHDDPDFEGGTVGDSWLSLENLPGVIIDADRQGKLVQFRHVD